MPSKCTPCTKRQQRLALLDDVRRSLARGHRADFFAALGRAASAPSPGTSGITNTSSARPLSPPPLSALYPQNRQLTLRLRVFLDWVSRIFGEARL
ncbi:hypothetical protein ACVWXO_009013 [Bradyrhizobium sp. LM2.7]